MTSETPSEAWIRCAPFLQRALDRSDDRFSLNDAKARVEAGRALFMPAKHSAAVIEMTTDFHFWLAGGRMAEILERHTDAERMARSGGFDRMTMRGRPGWERVFAPLGYKPLTYLVKELT